MLDSVSQWTYGDRGHFVSVASCQGTKSIIPDRTS
ncbi:hypothetical protein [Vibrio phage vB_VpaP_M9]|nr:hypothetical protein [Vibrio phage vB_VpaP_M83]USL89853.1 hypothetical protein [Vibrio phage vB_VpaP_M9]